MVPNTQLSKTITSPIHLFLINPLESNYGHSVMFTIVVVLILCFTPMVAIEWYPQFGNQKATTKVTNHKLGKDKQNTV